MPLRSLLLLVVLSLAVPAQAQDLDAAVAAEVLPPARDIRALRAIYDVEHPAFTAAMRAADWTSIKAFYGVAPALWLGTFLFDGERDFKPAYLMTLTEVGAVGAVFALKDLVERPRPYVSLPDIASRSAGHDGTFVSYSFPSGHAALSFALATSASISFPEWYVIAPAALWATAVSVSRPWLGVHYPTDIVAGAVLGVGIAFGVHALGELITPDFLRGDALDAPPPPTVHLVIPF